MKITRRSTLALIWAGSLAASVRAQTFPLRPVTIVAVAPPGGSADLAARALQEPLGRALGQAVVVHNKSGAYGTVAGAALLNEPKDGHTLLMQFSSFQTMSPHFVKLPYDPMAVFQPICNVLSAPQVLVVGPSMQGIKVVRDLIDRLKTTPGESTYASGGNGSVQHIAAELFKRNTETSIRHIPFRGSAQMVTSVLAGDVDMVLTTAPALLPHIEAGKLRPLLVTSNTRLKSLPDVPTAAEAGVRDLEVNSWFALYAHAEVPFSVVEYLAAEVQKIVRSQAFVMLLDAQGAQADFMGPQDMRNYARAESIRWRKIIQSAGIRAD